MKGAFLPAKVFQLFMLIIIGIGMTLIALLAASYAKDVHKIDVTLRLYHLPLKYENALLAFFETTDPGTGLPMKEIIAHAISQNNAKSVYVKGKTINLQLAAEPLMDKLTDNKDFLLRSVDPEVILAGNPEKVAGRAYKVSTLFVRPDGGTTELELYIS